MQGHRPRLTPVTDVCRPGPHWLSPNRFPPAARYRNPGTMQTATEQPVRASIRSARSERVGCPAAAGGRGDPDRFVAVPPTAARSGNAGGPDFEPCGPLLSMPPPSHLPPLPLVGGGGGGTFARRRRTAQTKPTCSLRHRSRLEQPRQRVPGTTWWARRHAPPPSAAPGRARPGSADHRHHPAPPHPCAGPARLGARRRFGHAGAPPRSPPLPWVRAGSCRPAPRQGPALMRPLGRRRTVSCTSMPLPRRPDPSGWERTASAGSWRRLRLGVAARTLVGGTIHRRGAV